MHLYIPAEERTLEHLVETGQRAADNQNRNGARAAHDVLPGTSWAFTDHRSIADLIAEGLL